MNRCPICERPVLGQPLVGNERPCHVPGGTRCLELGYERRGQELERLERSLRRALGVETRISEVA